MEWGSLPFYCLTPPKGRKGNIMKTSKNGIKLITQFEGCRLVSYQDSGGVWTIGYGHTSGVGPHMAITQQQAEAFLAYDLANKEKYVNQYDRIYHFTQNQFDALVSFCYNAGQGNLKKLVDGGNKPIELIARDLPNTCIKAKGKVLKGLIRRRKAEAELFGSPERDLDLIVGEVLAGMWGNGEDRKRKLTDAGYDYKQIQEEINKKLKS